MGLCRNYEFDRQVSCAYIISASGHLLQNVADMETWDSAGTMTLRGNSAMFT